MKKYIPVTPSRRQMTGVSYRRFLTRAQPEKPLTFGRKRRVGRATFGRITVRHKGSGHKRLWREVDFLYKKHGIPAKILSLEYDPNRSGFIGLVVYKDGEKNYLLLPSSVRVGDTVISSPEAEIKPGNRLPLEKIPVGAKVYNIEIKPGTGAKIVRAAGVSAEVLAHDAGFVDLKLPSGEVRKFPQLAWASIGQVSNEERGLITIGKAGRSRWLGIRPTVRGSAMAAVDHPYGGGEGRQLRGTRRPKNMWGKGVRGVKTRNKKKYSNYLIVSRRKKKKKR